MAVKKKVKVKASDIIKALEEADLYVLWSASAWKARKRLYDAAGYEETF